jgi:hypothetical protein
LSVLYVIQIREAKLKIRNIVSIHFFLHFSEYWNKHADVQVVYWIQAKTGEEQAAADKSGNFTSSSSSSSDDDDDDDDSKKIQDAGNEETKQERGSESEDSDSNKGYEICNKFSVLGIGE